MAKSKKNFPMSIDFPPRSEKEQQKRRKENYEKSLNSERLEKEKQTSIRDRLLGRRDVGDDGANHREKFHHPLIHGNF